MPRSKRLRRKLRPKRAATSTVRARTVDGPLDGTTMEPGFHGLVIRVKNPVRLVPRVETAPVLRTGVVRGKSRAYMIDDEWRTGIRAEMRSQGVSDLELGRRTGMSKATVSQTLKLTGQRNFSHWVEAIHSALRLKPPSETVARTKRKTTPPEVPVTTPAAPVAIPLTQVTPEPSSPPPDTADGLAALVGAIASQAPREVVTAVIDAMSSEKKRRLARSMLDAADEQTLAAVLAELFVRLSQRR